MSNMNRWKIGFCRLAKFNEILFTFYPFSSIYVENHPPTKNQQHPDQKNNPAYISDYINFRKSIRF